jgi:hypothetical protein
VDRAARTPRCYKGLSRLFPLSKSLAFVAFLVEVDEEPVLG